MCAACSSYQHNIMHCRDVCRRGVWAYDSVCFSTALEQQQLGMQHMCLVYSFLPEDSM
jgi:hypothetical protein